MKKWTIVLCVLMAAVFMFTACSSSEPAASSSPSTSEESSAAEESAAEESANTGVENDELESPTAEASTEASSGESTSGGGSGKYAFVFKSTGNPYGEKMMQGFEDAIKELGHEAILRAPDQPTAEGQIQMVEELIAQGVDAITIAANDPDALQPVLTKAMNAGIKVNCTDSAVNAQSRQCFVNQAGTYEIAESLMNAVLDMTGGSGEWAILSATSQATNQNAWIAAMQELAESDSKYADLELVKIAYGDDLRDKSTSETEALLQSYPDLKCIVAPTTVGIAAAGKVLTDKNLAGTIKLTGLGLPSEMAEYIQNDVCPYMYLWNPIDMGYLSAYNAVALVDGTIDGTTAGETFDGGSLGQYEVVNADDGGTEVILGNPFEFNKENIEEWKDVY